MRSKRSRAPAKAPTELLSANSDEAVRKWNAWRRKNPSHRPRLRYASLNGALLQYADLRDADLRSAQLRGAHLYGANLSRADLRGATLVGATLAKANLTRADLRGALLVSAIMTEGTIVRGARLTGCNVYGVAAWGLIGEPKDQADLRITLPEEPLISVDNIAIAQFIYLIIHNAAIRGVIDAMTSKIVLILGRFTPKRKATLDALRDHLRGLGCAPVMFDFAKPSLTTIETVTLLARMARLVIADLTDAKAVMQELQAIVSSSPSVTIQPIIVASQREPFMVDSLKVYPWFQPTIRYRSFAALVANLEPVVLAQGPQ